MPTRTTVSTSIALVLALCLMAPACKEVGIPDCPPETVLSDGLCRTVCASNADCLSSEACDPLLRACVSKVDDPPPRIVRFTVTPEVIRSPGEVVTFEYEVTGASAVEIAPGVLPRTDALSMIFNAPVGATTTFTLTAFGDGMTSADRTVRLEGGEVAIASFVASPEVVKPGDDITLSWDVRNAMPGSIRISEPEGRRFIVEDAPPSGMTVDQARRLPVEYWIEAMGADQRIVRAHARVTRLVDGSASITRFEPEPAQIRALDTTLVRWETRDASGLTFDDFSGALYSTQDPFELGRGFRLVAPLASAGYALSVEGPRGDPASSYTSVEVSGPSLPEVVVAEVEPRFGGSGSSGLTLSWEVRGAAKLELVVDDVLVGEVDPNDRRVVAAALRNMVFRLVAENEGSVAEARLVSWYVASESEPNFGTMSADPITEVARYGVLDHLDVDTYSIEVEDSGSIVARIAGRSDGNGQMGGCGFEVQGIAVELLGLDGNTPIAFAALNGEGCPELEAHRLIGGTYFLRVSGAFINVEIVEYTLLTDLHGPACGDGLVEREEMCDDYNRSAGDGCDGYCRIEAERKYQVSSEPAGSAPLPLVPVQPIIFKPAAFGDRSATIALPFIFELFGRRYAGAVVHTSGYISFRPEPEDAGAPAPMPEAGAPNALIAPFWADIVLADFPAAVGEVYSWNAGRGAGPDRFHLAFRNLTGREHTEADHVLIDALVTLEQDTNIVRVQYGRLRLAGDPAKLAVYAGIEDEKGGRAYLVPGCDPECTRESNPAESVVTFTPVD